MKRSPILIELSREHHSSNLPAHDSRRYPGSKGEGSNGCQCEDECEEW